MFCKHCGGQIPDESTNCELCGKDVATQQQQTQQAQQQAQPNQQANMNYQQPQGQPMPNQGYAPTNPNDIPSTGANFASCCFPIVGLVLYFVWKDEKPKAAKSACKFAWIGIGTVVALYILYFIFMFAIIGMGF